MADGKDLLDDATTRAVVAAGRDAAKRAALDLLSTDEERGARQVEQAKTAKKRRWKLLALGTIGLCVLIGVIGMLVSYWHWFLLAGLGGIASMLAYRWLRGRMAARKAKPAERIEAPSPSIEQAAQHRGSERVAAPAAGVPEEDVLAEAEASAEAVEEELAALKARLEKSRRG